MTGLYIHIPYCKSKCGYCSFYSKSDKESMPLFLRALKAEITQKAAKYSTMSDISHDISDKNHIMLDIVCADTLYFGGGTPSCLPIGYLKQIIECVKENFQLSKNSEITVEVNPDSCTHELIKELVESGVNRISLGLQTHDDIILKKLGRAHSFKQFMDAVEIIKSCGIANISADIMTGLMGQDEKSVLSSLEILTVIDEIKHISLYSLSVEEGTPLSKSGYIPDQDLQSLMYNNAVEFLSKKGYNRYEVSNFAKGGYHSKHNSKYWVHENYLGFGPSAHSFIINKRIENSPNLSQYNLCDFKTNEIDIDSDELVEEYIMLSLRTSSGLDLGRLKQKYGYDLYSTRKNEIAELEKNGFINIDNNVITVSSGGYYILNAIILKLI